MCVKLRTIPCPGTTSCDVAANVDVTSDALEAAMNCLGDCNDPFFYVCAIVNRNKHHMAVRLSWLENAYLRPFFSAGDFDHKVGQTVGFRCVIRVYY